jgi:hypothetical protein
MWPKIITRSSALFAYAGTIAIFLYGLACAQTNAPRETIPLKDFVKILVATNSATSNELSRLGNSPDAYNQLAKTLGNPLFGGGSAGGFFGLLTNLQLRLKAFDANGSSGAGLGLEYAYERALQAVPLSTNPMTRSDLTLNFHSRGNIAFNQEENPDDFLDTGLAFHFFYRTGGVDPTLYKDEAFAANREALIKAAQVRGTPEEVNAHPAWRDWHARVRKALTTQYVLDTAANLSLESNQDFSSKQYTYGLQAGGVIRAWNEDSPWARFNLLDWPFAALRILTGAQDRGKFTPSGQALPAVLAGVDMVDPFDNSVRLAVDPDDDPYPRVRVEVVFKTQVARLFDKDLWFSAGYRYFQELGASSAIRAADLNLFQYFAASLEFVNGVSLTYSTGKLPLDRESDQVFAIGYNIQF